MVWSKHPHGGRREAPGAGIVEPPVRATESRLRLALHRTEPSSRRPLQSGPHGCLASAGTMSGPQQGWERVGWHRWPALASFNTHCMLKSPARFLKLHLSQPDPQEMHTSESRAQTWAGSRNSPLVSPFSYVSRLLYAEVGSLSEGNRPCGWGLGTADPVLKPGVATFPCGAREGY